MEAKKNNNLETGQYRSVFFSIGLLVSLGIANVMFSWKSYDKPTVHTLGKSTNSFEELLEVPISKIPVIIPTIVVQPNIVSVPDEQDIEEDVDVDFDVDITQEMKIKAVVNSVPEGDLEEEDIEEIFVIVEKPAKPIGGYDQFYKNLSEILRYPPQALRMGTEGKVFVQFVINRDGTFCDFEVVRGIGAGCDEEAVRALSKCPKWKPAQQRAKTVRQRMVIAVRFFISSKSR